MNRLPLRKSYEVLRVKENDYFENENRDITQRTIISEHSNKKMRKGRNCRFVNKISAESFFHNDVVNQNPTVVPGHRSHANTTKYDIKMIVFGDSHLGHINKKLFSNSLPKCRTHLKYFSKARTNDLEYYVTAALNKGKPDIVAIKIDANDTDIRQLHHNTVENIGKDVINIGKKCRQSGVSEVIMSSVLVKNNIKLTKFIRQLNDVWRNVYLVNDFYFISNDNITRDFIYQDGVYLNQDGTCLLAGNFADFLNAINNF